MVNRKIPDFAAGNLETVKVMRSLARERMTHPKVRQLALNIISGGAIGSHNYLDEAQILGEFVQKNVRYVRDPHGVEQLHDPLYMIQKIEEGTAQGDCDDQALLLATLLLSIGAQPYFAMVRYTTNGGSYNHIYTVVYEKNWTSPRKRFVLDTIIKDKPMGFEVPHASIKEIPV